MAMTDKEFKREERRLNQMLDERLVRALTESCSRSVLHNIAFYPDCVTHFDNERRSRPGAGVTAFLVHADGQLDIGDAFYDDNGEVHVNWACVSPDLIDRLLEAVRTALRLTKEEQR